MPRSEASIQQRREYAREYSRQHYAENPERQKEIMAKYRASEGYKSKHDERKTYGNNYMQRRREERRKWFRALKSTMKCAICGYSHPAALDFHHRDPSIKIDNVSKLMANLVKEELILEEIAKCEILCANCHRILHDQEFEE